LIDEENKNIEDYVGKMEMKVNDVVVVVLNREGKNASVAIKIQGGDEYEEKEIKVKKVIDRTNEERDGRIKKGERIM
jgi:hypothetical protein